MLAPAHKLLGHWKNNLRKKRVNNIYNLQYEYCQTTKPFASSEMIKLRLSFVSMEHDSPVIHYK